MNKLLLLFYFSIFSATNLVELCETQEILRQISEHLHLTDLLRMSCSSKSFNNESETGVKEKIDSRAMPIVNDIRNCLDHRPSYWGILVKKLIRTQTMNQTMNIAYYKPRVFII
jgi:F-box domain